MIKKIAIILVIFYLNNVQAGFIRDSEIEEVIDVVISPLKEAANLKKLRIYLLDDITPNAFTIGGDTIFVNSGLIIHFPDPDILRGVIAHEIGHILGHHIIRRAGIIDNYTLMAMATGAVGLAASSGNADSALAIMLAGLHISDRSIKAYSRAFESSADQAALKLLEHSRHSAIGMIKFFEKMDTNSRYLLVNPYEQTHPLSQQRLNLLRARNNVSKYNNSQNNREIIYQFQRIAIKLAAYTDNINLLPKNYINNSNELSNYAKSIVNFKAGKFNNALKYVNNLLDTKTDDPYYHELKGQILFESSKTGALKHYNLALKIKPNDILLLLGRAIIGVEYNKNQPSKLDAFYQDLTKIMRQEPDNLLALYYIAVYYEKKGLIGKSRLNSAIIASKLNQHETAKMLVLEALKYIKPQSPDWYKANDIIALSQ